MTIHRLPASPTTLAACLGILAAATLLAGCPPTGDPIPEPTTEAIAEPETADDAAVDTPLAAPYEGDDAAYFTINSKPWSTMTIDGALYGNTPKKDKPIAPGKHTVVLTCGACEVEQEKTLVFTVAAGETYTSVRNQFDPPYTAGLDPAELTDVTGDPDAESAPAYEAYTGDDTAYMTINAKPWSTLFLDGALVGNTPKKSLAIAPGKHTVKLRCGPCSEPQGKTLEFTVAAGETYTSVRNEFEP